VICWATKGRCFLCRIPSSMAPPYWNFILLPSVTTEWKLAYNKAVLPWWIQLWEEWGCCHPQQMKRELQPSHATFLLPPNPSFFFYSFLPYHLQPTMMLLSRSDLRCLTLHQFIPCKKLSARLLQSASKL